MRKSHYKQAIDLAYYFMVRDVESCALVSETFVVFIKVTKGYPAQRHAYAINAMYMAEQLLVDRGFL